VTSRRTWRGRLARFGQRCVDDVIAAVFPATCRSCGRDLESQTTSAGLLSRRISHPASGQLRRRLAGPLTAPLVLLCPACAAMLRAPREAVLRLQHPVAPGIDMPCVSAFAPGPEIFALIHALKYERCLELVPWFSVHLARAARRAAAHTEPPDMLVPVPLHDARRRERGYNQSELLARQLESRLGAPVAAHAAARRRPTLPQAAQAPEERWGNLRDAFAARVEAVRGSIWLLDDVVTSGSTVHALADALRARGARRLVALTLCRARPDIPA
jgi:ComF family protein